MAIKLDIAGAIASAGTAPAFREFSGVSLSLLLECFSVISEKFQWVDTDDIDAYESAIAGLMRDALQEVSMPTSTVPIGVFFPFAGGIELSPEGYLFCDGSDYLKTDYPDLFSVIGVLYGTPSNSSYFRVPNMVDRFPLGASTSSAYIGMYGGKNLMAINTGMLPPHNHSVTTYVTSAAFVGAGSVTRSVINSSASGLTGNVGAGESFDITPKHVVTRYIIRAV